MLTDQQQHQSQNYYQAKLSALIDYHPPKQVMESAWQAEEMREITRSRCDTHARVITLQLENENVDREIASVRQQIQSIPHDENQHWIDEENRSRANIGRLKGYIHGLEKYHTTLAEEIDRYYSLLEGNNNQAGLLHFTNEAKTIMDRRRSLLDWLHLHWTREASEMNLSHTIRDVTHSISYSSGNKQRD